MRTIKLDTYGAWTFLGGRPVWVEGEDKLRQDVDEILSTEFSGLNQRIGEVPSDQLAFAGAAALQVRQALEELARMHAEQRPDQRTPAEVLARVTSVNIAPGFLAFSPAARTRYVVNVRLASKAGVLSEQTKVI